MLIFESLNCILCKEPFARKPDQPRSPRKLACGLTMCHECFKKERAQEKEKRKHRCHEVNCFYNPNFAHYLIDLLADEDALRLLPMERGYTLTKPFKMLECSVCHVEYSTKIQKPYDLFCNHIICMGCFLKLRVRNRDSTIKRKYIITCPICKVDTHASHKKIKNRLEDFMDELPTLIQQLGTVCDECHEKDLTDCMLYCSPCGIKICESCKPLKHGSHDARSLLTKQAAEMLVELQSDSTTITKGYRDLLSELNKGILEDITVFETNLLSKENTLANASNYVDLMERHQGFAKFNTDFKAITEEYLPVLRKFETKVKALTDALDKDAVPNVASADVTAK